MSGVACGVLYNGTQLVLQGLRPQLDVGSDSTAFLIVSASLPVACRDYFT